MFNSIDRVSLADIQSARTRPDGVAVLTKPAASLAAGIFTASSGNSALAVAWMARHLGTVTAVVPEDAAEVKRRVRAQFPRQQRSLADTSTSESALSCPADISETIC